MERPFVGQRVRLARNFMSLTLSALGDKVAASPALLSSIESGKKQPSELLVAALGETLSVSPDFFLLPLTDNFQETECHLRHRKTSAKKLKTKALADGTMFGMLIAFLANRIPERFPDYNVPAYAVSSMHDVESAALYCREYWGLGVDTPISSMVGLLEWVGVAVMRLDEKTKKIDAFSRAGPTNVVVLNTFKDSATRSRFDCGHELGHLVMHRGVETGDEITERQADRFASAFLMPRDEFAEDFRGRRGWSWEYVFELKQHWVVSAPAIVRRAFDLELIGAAQYRRSYKYMSAKGWLHGKVKEPYEPDVERPRLVKSALEYLEAEYGETPLDVAGHLGWTPWLMERIADVPVSHYEQRAGVVSFAQWRAKKAPGM